MYFVNNSQTTQVPRQLLCTDIVVQNLRQEILGMKKYVHYPSKRGLLLRPIYTIHEIDTLFHETLTPFLLRN